MDFFHYEDQFFHCEEVYLRDIADEVGTPTYVYSHRTLARHAQVIDGVWDDYDHLTCYSVKANSNLAILRILAEAGLGADIVSGGELYRALKAGFPPSKIVFSGVGKTVQELRAALREDILAFNVESIGELEALNRIAESERRKARVSFRINPDVDPQTHPKIATGLKTAKFGIPHADARDAYRRAAELEWIEIVGIDAHIGSGLLSVKPFVEAAERLLELVEQIRADGIALHIIDIGGGLGITYNAELPPSPAEWAAAVGPMLSRAGLKIIMEPGRSMVGNAGVLLTRVLYLKENEGKNFIVVDAGMNALIRPALYDSYHRILPVIKRDRQEISADIVGPICETGDVLARERTIVQPYEGDVLSVMSAGAYGFTMASTYNSQPRPAEVLVRGSEFQVIRDRETYEDLIRGERFMTLSEQDS